jgi:hypothetical protein
MKDHTIPTFDAIRESLLHLGSLIPVAQETTAMKSQCFILFGPDGIVMQEDCDHTRQVQVLLVYRALRPLEGKEELHTLSPAWETGKVTPAIHEMLQKLTKRQVKAEHIHDMRVGLEVHALDLHQQTVFASTSRSRKGHC